MKNMDLGICLAEETHGCALAAALNLIGGFDMTVYPPEDAEILRGIHSHNSFWLLSAGMDLTGISGKILLAVSEPEEEDLDADPPRVWAFSPAPSMAAKLKEAAGMEREEDGPRDQHGAAVLVFTAEAGGLGTTTLAVHTAAALFRIFGERSLYINLLPGDRRAERLFGAEPTEEEDRFLRLLFCLERGRTPDLSRYVEEGTWADRIPAPVLNRQCGEFGKEDADRVAYAASASGYRYLILDVGSHLDGGRLALAENAYRTIWLREREESLAPWEGDRTLDVEAGGLMRRLDEEAERIARAVGGV